MAKVDPYSSWGINENEEFDHLLSLLDFPMESLEGDGLVGDWDVCKSQYLGPIPSEIGPPMIAQTKPEPIFVDIKAGLNEATPSCPIGSRRPPTRAFVVTTDLPSSKSKTGSSRKAPSPYLKTGGKELAYQLSYQ